MALGATWLSDHPWHRGACVRSTGHERSLTPKKRHDERPWSPEPWCRQPDAAPNLSHGRGWRAGPQPPEPAWSVVEESRCALTQQVCRCFRRKYWQAPAQGRWQGCTWPGQPSRRTPPPASPCGPGLNARLCYQTYHKWGIRWPGDVTRPLLFKDKRRQLLVRRSPRRRWLCARRAPGIVSAASTWCPAPWRCTGPVPLPSRIPPDV